MRSLGLAVLLGLILASCGGKSGPAARSADSPADEAPTRGGRLAVALGADPKTLNPIFAADHPSTAVVRRTTADLIHINRLTQQTEGALAESWTVSEDGTTYRLELRRGVLFSDGEPFDADDVVFSFRAIQDEAVASPNRDLLVLDGVPIEVRKIASHTVEFDLGKPHAVGDRVFDSVPILPSHLLEESYLEGTLGEVWGLGADPAAIAGLGPFRFKSYAPAQRLVLERNPHYWRKEARGGPLPYLDELVFQITPNEDTQALRFQSGEIDLVDGLSAANFSVLEAGAADRGYELFDLGPGLQFDLLFFNLNPPDPRNEKQRLRAKWLGNKAFRQAVSAAVDREGIARLVYRGRATPIWSQVSPGNRLWFNADLPRPPRSLERARALLSAAGFSWRDGRLVDADSLPVALSLATNSSNSARVQMLTIIGEDLRELGMQIQIVTLELRALIGRVFETKDYDLCVLALGGGDADPNPLMNVLLSSGATHLWNPGSSQPPPPWQAEIDRLMTGQATVLARDQRKRMYDRVQELIADELPMVALVSPNVLVGARSGLGNFRPAILDHQTLWNVEELYWKSR